MKLKLVNNSELEEVKACRASIFRDELNIQYEYFQDIFNDSLSKNFVVVNGEEIVSGIRIAFSREMQRFYISYLFINFNSRNKFSGVLLLGIVFNFMKLNKVHQIYADAYDKVLPLYLKFGCVENGSDYFKYGFNCLWHPLVYTYGSNKKRESSFIKRASKFLKEDFYKWDFAVTVILCKNIEDYKTCLDILISTGEIKKYTLCLLDNKETAIPFYEVEYLLFENIKDFINLTAVDESKRFTLINKNFSNKNILIIKENSSISPFAQYYSLMTGKKIITDKEIENNPITDTKTVLIVGSPSEHLKLKEQIKSYKQCGAIVGTETTVSKILLNLYYELSKPLDELKFQRKEVLLEQINKQLLTKEDSSFNHRKKIILEISTTQFIVVDSTFPFLEEASLFAFNKIKSGITLGEIISLLNEKYETAETDFLLFGDPSLKLFNNDKLSTKIYGV